MQDIGTPCRVCILDNLKTFLPVEILDPAAFPHPIKDLRVEETNLSWIVLTGSYAYKIKKSKTLSFVDQSTLERRKTLCEEELRLNQRLAGSLYEAVVPIARVNEHARVGGSGIVIDYAVKMKQFDTIQELSTLLRLRAVEAEELADLGVRLADFHLSLPQAGGASDFQSTQHLHDEVSGILATNPCRPEEGVQCVPCAKLGALAHWTHDFLQQSLFLLARREQDGHIRECHGDLHTRNIVRWGNKLVPFNSLEFDSKRRWIDTMNDVAVLFTDLSAHDRRDLAFDFLNAYLSRTGDYGGLRLLRFYSIYRALIRARADLLSADGEPSESESHREKARLGLINAAALLDAKDPALIIMHGPSGSGKSFVSTLFAEQLGGVRIGFDVERNRLQDKVGAVEIHSGEFSRRTYEHLLECAKSCLQGGFTAIVDAAFLDVRNRNEFAAWADCHGNPFLIVSCEAEVYELESRIKRRHSPGVDATDADIAVLHRQLRAWVPLGMWEKSQSVTVDTMQPDAAQEALPQLRAMLHLRSARTTPPSGGGCAT